jgi:acetyltransferase-like isoleucine patch superfamily enzyme
MAKIRTILRHLCREYSTGIAALLPNDVLSIRLRRLIYSLNGIDIHRSSVIYRNVLLLGKISIGENSSISNNSTLSGANAGISIGANVMIAPGCCLVAFDHGMAISDIPMISQPLREKGIVVEDDVWIAANCTITKGVRIGTGAVIAANSVVIRDVPPFEIVAGNPAKTIKNRNL